MTVKINLVYLKKKKYLYIIDKISNVKYNQWLFEKSIDCQIKMKKNKLILCYDISNYQIKKIEDSTIIFSDDFKYDYQLKIPFK